MHLILHLICGKRTTSLQLGSTLAQSFLDSALNPRTVRQYRGSYHRWETFCQTNNLTELPADPKHIAACLALTASETWSVAAVEKLCAAVAFEHRKAFLPSPTCHGSILLLLRSIRIHFLVERQSKKPLTHYILCRMIDHLSLPEHGRDGLLAPLALWRTIWRAHLEFYTLGRFNDIIHLCRQDVMLREEPKMHLVVKFIRGTCFCHIHQRHVFLTYSQRHVFLSYTSETRVFDIFRSHTLLRWKTYATYCPS